MAIEQSKKPIYASLKGTLCQISQYAATVTASAAQAAKATKELIAESVSGVAGQPGDG